MSNRWAAGEPQKRARQRRRGRVSARVTRRRAWPARSWRKTLPRACAQKLSIWRQQSADCSASTGGRWKGQPSRTQGQFARPGTHEEASWSRADDVGALEQARERREIRWCDLADHLSQALDLALDRLSGLPHDGRRDVDRRQLDEEPGAEDEAGHVALRAADDDGAKPQDGADRNRLGSTALHEQQPNALERGRAPTGDEAQPGLGLEEQGGRQLRRRRAMACAAGRTKPKPRQQVRTETRRARRDRHRMHWRGNPRSAGRTCESPRSAARARPSSRPREAPGA